MDKAKRIAELEAELEKLKTPRFSLLRVFGKDVKVITKKRHAPMRQHLYMANGKLKHETTHAVRLIEYTED